MDELGKFKEHHESQIDVLKFAQDKKRKAGDAIFALYKNLLDKTNLLKWKKIVQKQISITLWTNLNGKVHDTFCLRTIRSFKDCVKFYLLQVFPDDAAERQKLY